ncbi:MAG: AAA family ATPase [Candidatus Woesearchaeota archaeon]|nr:AAA family ATPase [Candidatus Woesearchaeota archaeon]
MPSTNDEDILNKVMAHYTIDVSAVEEENRVLRETVNSLKDELGKFNKTPLLIAEVKELIGENVILRLNNGNEFFVDVSSACSDARPGDTVLVEQRNLTVVKKLSKQKKFNVEKFVIIEKPTISWEQIGGLSVQANEIREVIELPLLKPELFKKVGISPPKGILLHGEPGTGKTLLAKAVAASTNSTFIEIVGSELVQKFIGEGSKLVKEIFALAREKAPSIIFIDEIDAIAATRIDIGTSGEREVQRTFMQLLAEVDGFKPLGNVKIIGCTNRKDILDPAIMRPGRLDRIIEVPPPSVEGIKEIFKIHTAPMKLAKINIDELGVLMTGFSGADIKSVCTEAGYFAIRTDRFIVSQQDFKSAIEKIKKAKNEDPTDHRAMFG